MGGIDPPIFFHHDPLRRVVPFYFRYRQYINEKPPSSWRPVVKEKIPPQGIVLCYDIDKLDSKMTLGAGVSHPAIISRCCGYVKRIIKKHDFKTNKFIQTHGEDAAAIRSALTAGNRGRAGKMAHALKGVAGSLAAFNVHRIE